jgi:hypothetical protein
MPDRQVRLFRAAKFAHRLPKVLTDKTKAGGTIRTTSASQRTGNGDYTYNFPYDAFEASAAAPGID